MRVKAIVLTLATLMACSEQEQDSVLTMEAKAGEFSILIPAKGELKSASEVVINAPSSVRGSLTLSWLKEENSIVEAGEVVARFDGEQHRLKRDQASLELEKIQLSKNETERSLSFDRFSIEQQSLLIEDEIAMTDKFSSEDLSIYSKNEVIEQLLNKDYLTAKDKYLNWSKDSKSEQGSAQIDLLALQGKGHSDKISMHESALKQLEVTAPQSGILIHSKNWRGEKVREGSSLWAGSKLASIPSLDQMQAKLYVLETEAAGLKVEQTVEVTLDAYPEKLITGRIASVASIATPKRQGNPVKYFEVVVDLDGSDPEFMKPGQKLSASIIIERRQGVISIPNQVIYQDAGESWVYVKRGERFEKQVISVGLRSLTRSQLIDGVQPGEHIALMEPTIESKS